MKVKFTIPGEPKGKARPRVTKGGITYTPAETVNYENWVKVCYQQQVNRHLGDGQIEIEVDMYYSIPKSAAKGKILAMKHNIVRPTKKPDCDNVLKAIADSLNGIAYKDDSQIVTAVIRKLYSVEPRVEVEIFDRESDPDYVTGV
ncbi:MAG: hypothetical protein AWM53_02002 [Candidatus Dichloromethanomonas elyunquensis]|nr:MAG: hypothetical protein AWM53_02002 [Candidatus Dichloromethanomonas elyunquensis]